MDDLLSTAPNFAGGNPRLNSNNNLGRHDYNRQSELRNVASENQDGDEWSIERRATPATEFLAVHSDIQCGLLSSAPQRRSHPAYKALSDAHIRLLRILPAEPGTVIRCRIEEFPLQGAPAYTALSYTWGSQHGIYEIYINDQPLLVPKNLWRFLSHAGAFANGLSGWLWVDMLSVNQVDLVERGHQVNLMPRIYGTANEVVVWLGPAYRGSDVAMSALAKLPSGKGFAKQASRIWACDAGHALDGICRRPYWRRLWVFQEIRLAQKARLMCGSKVVTWDRFQALMQLAHTESSISQPNDNTEVVVKSPAMRMIRLNLKSVDTMLWTLVQETRHLRCSDTKDKIYALLGVAAKGHESIEPDYSMPVPTLLNRLLHEIWSDSPPKTLEEAAKLCAKIEDVLGVEQGTVFTLQGQRGRYNAPSDVEMRRCRLGPKSCGITLWWTAFYGHSSVQTLLREDWAVSHFDGDPSGQSDAPSDANFTSAPVVSLLQFLRKEMDIRTSFLLPRYIHQRMEYDREIDKIGIRGNFSGGVYAGLEGMEEANQNGSFAFQDLSVTHQVTNDQSSIPTREDCYSGLEIEDTSLRNSSSGLADVHARLGTETETEIEDPEFNAEVTDIDVCMAWVAFCLTDAIQRKYSHITRLMLDIGVGCGLLYTQYRPLFTLIEAIAGALCSAVESESVVLLQIIISRADRFISDTDSFVAAMLECGRMLNKSGLLLELGLMEMVQPHQRAALLGDALSEALLKRNDEAVEALLRDDECNPNCVVDGRSALSYCIFSRQQSNLRALLATGKCDVDVVDPLDGKTPLMQAAWEGLHIYVRAFVETGASRLDDANPLDGMTPLLYAASRGQADALSELLADRRCNVDKPHRRGKTALMMAVEGNHARTLSLILTYSQQDLNLPNDSGNTALSLALTKGFHKVVRCLSMYPACNVNLRDISGDTPLMLAVKGERADMVGELTARERCDMNASDKDGNTALSMAISMGEAEIIRELLDCERCNVNDRNEFGSTPLMRTLQSGRYSLASRLLACERCDVNAADNIGMTPLMVAVASSPDNHPIVDALLDIQDCDVNAQDESGRTALMHAGDNGNAWHVESLLRTRRCNIDKPLPKGNRTVLHMAAFLDRPSFLRQLLRQPSLDLRVRNDMGQTPLIVAVSVRRLDNVKLLLSYEAGCGVNMRSENNNTAISLAVTARDYEMVCLLVNSGRVKDMCHWTGEPLHTIAREQGDADIERVLIELAERLETRWKSDGIGDVLGT